MDLGRYEGYVTARDVIAVEMLDGFSAEVLQDLAEGLLLARDAGEAEAAREHVPEALGLLVDRGNLTRRAADRFWECLKACGPRMKWSPSWDRATASPQGSAVRGH
jgi:hypothetical protein